MNRKWANTKESRSSKGSNKFSEVSQNKFISEALSNFNRKKKNLFNWKLQKPINCVLDLIGLKIVELCWQQFTRIFNSFDFSSLLVLGGNIQSPEVFFNPQKLPRGERALEQGVIYKYVCWRRKVDLQITLLDIYNYKWVMLELSYTPNFFRFHKKTPQRNLLSHCWPMR